MKAKEFDVHFGHGSDIELFVEMDRASRPNRDRGWPAPGIGGCT